MVCYHGKYLFRDRWSLNCFIFEVKIKWLSRWHSTNILSLQTPQSLKSNEVPKVTVDLVFADKFRKWRLRTVHFLGQWISWCGWTSESVGEFHKCDHSNENHWAVLSCGAVYCAVQGGSKFGICGWVSSKTFLWDFILLYCKFYQNNCILESYPHTQKLESFCSFSVSEVQHRKVLHFNGHALGIYTRNQPTTLRHLLWLLWSTFSPDHQCMKHFKITDLPLFSVCFKLL